jgi:Domain of unknown function (DUF4382)
MKMIKMKNKILLIAPAFFLFAVSITSCKKEDDTNSGTGTASTAIKVTDAPMDDVNVSGAFVTISAIKVDGQTVQGFTKTTVDLAAYQNGNTKTLGNFNLEGKTYSNITFVLDFDTDANGNAPGSYVLTTSNVKHKLSSGSNAITVAKSYTLQSNASNSIVADFDLRKMIVAQSGNPADEYDFATTAELQNDVRVVAESNAGTISGTLTDGVSGSAKVVAYAYRKGTYDRTTEMQGQGASGVQFSNAVSSTLVGAGGSYQLHFLEAGDYEIHYASYKDTNADGKYELQGTLVVLASGGLDILNLHLNINATLTMNATATAVLP